MVSGADGRGLTAYNMPFAWRSARQLKSEALRRALEAIVRRHEPLRTTFAGMTGSPGPDHRRRSSDLSCRWKISVELESSNRREIAKRCRERRSGRLILTSDLMLRASLLRLAEDEHVLLLTLHHIASDGWSLDVVSGMRIAVLYDAYCRGMQMRTAGSSVQYADYAVWQRKELEVHSDSTTAVLAGAAEGVRPLELPTTVRVLGAVVSRKAARFYAASGTDPSAEVAGPDGRRHAAHDAAGRIS